MYENNTISIEQFAMLTGINIEEVGEWDAIGWHYTTLEDRSYQIVANTERLHIREDLQHPSYDTEIDIDGFIWVYRHAMKLM